MAQSKLPLYYRCLGFPCGIDGGPSQDERTDSTWMTEDVGLITRFLIEIKAHPAMSRNDLQASGRLLKEDDVRFPASTVFDTIEEIDQVLMTGEHWSDFGNRWWFQPSKHVHDSNFKDCPWNSVFFIYLTGHGLSKEQSERLADWRRNEALGCRHPQYAKYPISRNTQWQLVQSGQIIAFTEFLDCENFWSEYVHDCYDDFGLETTQPHDYHVVLVVDSCFSGTWLSELQEYASRHDDYPQKMSITIQTSASSESTDYSYGHFFTPLFVKLQHVDLNEYITEFNQLDPQGKDKLVREQQVRQFPKFLYVGPKSDEIEHELVIMDDILPVKTIHGLRFFDSQEFFAFFASKNQYEFLQIDFSRFSRPILSADLGAQFMTMLVAKKRHKQIKIRGMRLTRDEQRQPLCIVMLPSTCYDFDTRYDLTDENSYWYHLHIHFDGTTTDEYEFPGQIKHVKLYQASKREPNIWERKKGFDSDTASQDDNDDVRRMKLNAEKKKQRGDVEFYIPGWTEFSEELQTTLLNWVKSQMPRKADPKRTNTLKITALTDWRDPDRWTKLSYSQLGDIAVKSRSRYVITEQISDDDLVQNIKHNT